VDGAALVLLRAASETPLTDDDQGVSASDRETAYASRRDYVERFSPLHRLAQSDREDWAPSNLIRELVAASADVHSLSRRGLTPLHIAAAVGRAAACGALVRAGANAGYAQRGAAHETPLHAAVRARKVGALRAMLDDVPEASRRATCDATSCDGSTALHLACALGSVDACEALLDAGASVDARTHDGDSPLHVAAWTNSLAVADALLARGAPVDAAKLDGSTALHLCAARGLVAMTRSLLDHGADPTLRSVSGSTALDRARLFRDDRLARVLELAAATPPNSPTNTSG
jgi:ankyrin repeat protein